MTPHDRALELVRLSERDERAAHVLEADPTIDTATIAFHYQQAAEKLLKALLAEHTSTTHGPIISLRSSSWWRTPDTWSPRPRTS